MINSFYATSLFIERPELFLCFQGVDEPVAWNGLIINTVPKDYYEH